MKLFLTNEHGRSMIEMLGVLSIVGILSVGGIAGYSKAMYKYKTNNLISDFTILLNNLLAYSDIIAKAPQSAMVGGRYYLADFIKQLQFVPLTWSKGSSDYLIEPYFSHKVQVYFEDVNDLLAFRYYFNVNSSTGTSYSKNAELLCQTVTTEFARNYSSIIYRFIIYRTSGDYYDLGFGDNFCNNNNRPCFASQSVSEIVSGCSACEDGKPCQILMYIKL